MRKSYNLQRGRGFTPTPIMETTKFKNKLVWGFTLLEVMLAVSIISIALVIVINAFSLIVKSKATTSNYTKALFLLEKKFYELKTQGLSKYNQEGAFKPPFNKFSWHMESEIVPSRDLRKVLLVVSWEEASRNKELQIITYLRGENL